MHIWFLPQRLEQAIRLNKVNRGVFMKRKIAWILVAVLLLVAVTGCSKVIIRVPADTLNVFAGGGAPAGQAQPAEQAQPATQAQQRMSARSLTVFFFMSVPPYSFPVWITKDTCPASPPSYSSLPSIPSLNATVR